MISESLNLYIVNILMGSSTNNETEYVKSWASKNTSLQATFDILKLGIFNQHRCEYPFIIYPWVNVQNFKNPELSKLRS